MNYLWGALTFKGGTVCPAVKTLFHPSPAVLQIPSCGMIKFFRPPTLSKTNKLTLTRKICQNF